NFIRQIVESDLAQKKYATVHTRFPPEPNGYLHFGHAKSICLNFGLAEQYGGACNLRFDWKDQEHYASDYFERLYDFAEALVRRGHAYVDSQSADEIRQNRGTLTSPGKDSSYRERNVQEHLAMLRKMREGAYADGAHVLRAKIDMASPNMNLRDPV